MISARKPSLHRWRAAAICSAVVAFMSGADACAKDAHSAMTVAAPEGFYSLSAPRKLVVDVYLGGVRVGETQVVSAPGTVSLVDAAGVVNLVPRLADKAAAQAVLAAENLPANAHLVCTPYSDKSKCGYLEPDVAGVIFDSENFRLDLFVNPRLLTTEIVSANRYLPEPQAGVGVISSIAAIVSGSGDNSYYSLQNRLIVGNLDKRLRADLSYSTERQFNAEQIIFEIDRPELRYLAGAMWTPGLALAGRRKMLGVGIGTQIDTRLDKDIAIGTPLVVFLAQRGRVDALVEGRVVSSRIYDAGNQQIDTSQFPDGSFEVTLRIDEIGRGPREERRFFTKSRRIPPAGSLAFFGYGGLLIDDPLRRSLEPSSTPYFLGGVASRFGKSLSLDGSVEVAADTILGEIGISFFSRLASVRATAVGSADGGYGALLQISSAGHSPVRFKFDLRRVKLESERAFGFPGSGSGGSDQAWLGGTFPFPSLNDYTQVSGTVSYSFSGLRFLATASYRETVGDVATYNLGPSLEWELLRSGPLRLSARGDLSLTNRGEGGFLGISLRLLGGRHSMVASVGARSSSLPADDVGSGVVASIASAWNDPSFAGSELTLGAGLERDPARRNFFAAGEVAHPNASLSADVVHSEAGDDASTQYSFGLQTTLGIHGRDFVLDSRSTSESMVTAQVAGARAADRFEILVDEQPKGTLSGTERLTLSLPSYRAYDIRIRPLSGGLLSYDGSTRRIALYPGNVASLSWRAQAVQIMFGRLRYPDGSPVAHASLIAEGGWGETDADGFFQIETVDYAEVKVVTSDGKTFQARLPRTGGANEFANVGMIVCCGTSQPELALASKTPADRVKDK